MVSRLGTRPPSPLKLPMLTDIMPLDGFTMPPISILHVLTTLAYHTVLPIPNWNNILGSRPSSLGTPPETFRIGGLCDRCW